MSNSHLGKTDAHASQIRQLTVKELRTNLSHEVDISSRLNEQTSDVFTGVMSCHV